MLNALSGAAYGVRSRTGSLDLGPVNSVWSRTCNVVLMDYIHSVFWHICQKLQTAPNNYTLYLMGRVLLRSPECDLSML